MKIVSALGFVLSLFLLNACDSDPIPELPQNSIARTSTSIIIEVCLGDIKYYLANPTGGLSGSSGFARADTIDGKPIPCSSE